MAPADVSAMLAPLCGSEQQYITISSALRLAAKFTRLTLGAAGETARAERAFSVEFFHILRRTLQQQLGRRQLDAEPTWNRGQLRKEAQCWKAICDGSWKNNRATVGVSISDFVGVVRATVSVKVRTNSSVGAELLACAIAVETLVALGALDAEIEVDALSTIASLRGTLSRKYAAESARLQAAVGKLRYLKVLLVPRLNTRIADRLAAEI